jgi:hypothetical protein
MPQAYSLRGFAAPQPGRCPGLICAEAHGLKANATPSLNNQLITNSPEFNGPTHINPSASDPDNPGHLIPSSSEANGLTHINPPASDPDNPVYLIPSFPEANGLTHISPGHRPGYPAQRISAACRAAA